MGNEVRVSKPQVVELVGRKRATLSGVVEVIGVTDGMITLDTTEGGLVLSGKGIRVARFLREEGELVLDGEFTSLKYLEHAQSGGNFFTKMFK